MAMLTGPEIERQMELGHLGINPRPAAIGANSADLTLGPTILVYKKAHAAYKAFLTMEQRLTELRECYSLSFDHLALAAEEEAFEREMRRMEPLDMQSIEPFVEYKIPPEGMLLCPGILFLGHTNEVTETPRHVPCLEGRSSVGRLGLGSHVTAGFGDQNFRGDWTLELTVVQKLRVYANVRICQIFYTETVGAVRPYVGKYQGQLGPKPSMLWKDFERKT